MATIQANIHHFYPHPVTGQVADDEDGDPMLGYYFEIIITGRPSQLMGPYGSPEEAETACKKAWNSGDY